MSSSEARVRTRAAYRARSALSRRSRHWPLAPRLKNAAGSIHSRPPPGTVVSALLRIESKVAAWTRRGPRGPFTGIARPGGRWPPLALQAALQAAVVEGGDA